MKFLKKRAAMAFLLALSMMGTSIAPVFAEGSKELTTVPENINTKDPDGTENPGKQAHRPYIDWRDRDQFDMPSKNVIYVYANAGETICFGSNVTNADDKSIEAIVHKGSMDYDDDTKKDNTYFFAPSLNMSNSPSLSGMKGYSIAVTMPLASGEAYNPEQERSYFDKNSVQPYAEEKFRDGETQIKTNCDREKVYLFDVVENDKGHIANLTQEKNGPNGVDGTTNGYNPLSFVAPYNGTYSFRFLSTLYATDDDIIKETATNTDWAHYATIDFNGANNEPPVGAGGDNVNVDYYEENLGTITLINGNRYLVVQKTDDGKKYVFQASESYEQKDGTINSGGSSSDKGMVSFVPLHKEFKLKITWRAVENKNLLLESGKRSIRLTGAYNGNVNDCDVNNYKLQTTEITVNGADVSKALNIFITGDPYEIHSIEYLVDRTTAPAITPNPAPEPEPEPVPDPEVYNFTDSKYNTVFNSIGDNTNSTLGSDKSVDGLTIYKGLKKATNSSGNYTHNGQRYSFSRSLQVPSGTNTKAVSFKPKAACKVTVVFDGANNTGRTMSIYQGNESIASKSSGSGITSFTADIKDPSKDVYVYGSGNNNKRLYAVFVDYTPSSSGGNTSGGTNGTNGTNVNISTGTPQGELTPVSDKYLWDFTNTVSSRTQYTTTKLLSEYGYNNIMLYVNSGTTITAESGSVKMFAAGGVVNGAPYNALKILPLYKGTVDVIFETENSGTVTVQQGDTKKTVTAYNTENDGTKKSSGVQLDVTANEPVYIYAPTNGNVYLKSIKYTPDAGDTSDLYRTVNQPWAEARSQVSAWDITVASNEKTYNLSGEFKGCATGQYYSTDGRLMLDYYHSTNVISDGGVKLDAAAVENNIPDKRYFKYTSNSAGTIKVSATNRDANRHVMFYEEGKEEPEQKSVNGTEEVSYKVNGPSTVYIYSAGNGITYNSITFTPESSTAMISNPGRAWADVLYLNAGAFQKSIYPEFNILTKEGFLYDVKLNGIQPYSFVFYSNNRGFLLDPGSLYTDSKTTSRLQPLEHSFYSYTTESDVGGAPVRTEKDANGAPVNINGKFMVSRILGNHEPTDPKKDSTHKIFFNKPDTTAMLAYTESASKKVIDSSVDNYSNILSKIEYEGLGSYADNKNNDVHYGTIGVGGNFTLVLDAGEAKTLTDNGVESVSVKLNFSKYALNNDKAPVLYTDNTDGNKKWQTSDNSSGEIYDYEQNNIVTLSAVINGAGTYTMSWDGRDAYGNIVPVGIYTDAISSFVEMGTAHFPFLDAEHHPNGIKVKMLNKLSNGKFTDKADYIYYNNEAVSPYTDSYNASAWYYTGKGDGSTAYPRMIGDGKNMLGGTTTNFDNNNTAGAMIIENYVEEDYTITGSSQNRTDVGYGNYSAIDLWSKYEINVYEELKIGVKPIEKLQPYVSFVATSGTTGKAKPFNKSHLGYADKVIADYKGSNGWVTDGDKTYSTGHGLENIYGNTIATGFITNLNSDYVNSDYMKWSISIPVSAQSENGTELQSYIKIPDDVGKLFTQEDQDEADYLAYELYSGLFEDYAIADEEIGVGDEYIPDWETDTSLNENEEWGILGTPDGAEKGDNGFTEEMYIEAMSLSADITGDYTVAGVWDAKIKVEPDSFLEDPEKVQINKGNIYKISSFKTASDGADYDGVVKIDVAYKLPTTITGGGNVLVGIVIDNIYAPGATATAEYDTNISNLHNITSALFDDKDSDIRGSTNNSVTATTYDYYEKNENNMYSKADIPTPIVKVELEGSTAWGNNNLAVNYDQDSNASGGKAVDATQNGDIIYLGEVDMTDLNAIEVYAGSKCDKASFELYAVDMTRVNISSLDKNAATNLLKNDNLLGSSSIKMESWNKYYGHKVSLSGYSGTMGIFLKCVVGENPSTGYCGRFDYVNYHYNID